MRSLIKKIKDTIFYYYNQIDREEAMLRLRFLEYILFDFEYYGDFYVSSFHIFKRFAQVNEGIEDECWKSLQNRIDFLTSALEDSLQLEFESWTFGQGIECCDCEHYYSTRGWYDFYYVATDLLNAIVLNSNSNFNNGPEVNIRLITKKLRSSILDGKKEVGMYE